LIIFYPAATALLFLLSIPINWWAEFDADSKASEALGAEIIIATLLRLAEDRNDGLSVTHPSVAWRIRRLQKRWEQAR
jgi:Zn-dependent protease with chaperone function